MDLDSIEDILVTDAAEHPSKRDVRLEIDGVDSVVRNVIKRGMPKDWQQGAAAIMDGTYTTYVFLRRYCGRNVPTVGSAVIDGVDTPKQSSGHKR